MFQTIRTRNPKLRSLPYPFLGALSISNDVEFFHFDFFEALMEFLNTKKTTPFGKGLDLEVTSSFFFYSAHPYDFSYFSELEPQSGLSPWARRIEEYLRSGWIDTNHAYGDFDGTGGFRREHALRCYEVLAKLGLEINVFTNHGSAENIQNVGTDATYHRGDKEEHSAYHADLMKRNGVRYVWTDSMVTKQEDHLRKRTKFFGKAESVLRDCVLQDGSHLKGFIRFRSTGANAPNLSSLSYQIKQIDWKEFYENRGVIVLYQHLGILYRNAGVCHQATIDAICRRPEVYLAPFYILEREFRESRLWVCGLSKLLRYVDVVESVEIQYDSIKSQYNIVMDKVFEQPDIFFQGLTLYIDPTKPTHIYYRDDELPILHNGPDETGQYSVTVPLQALEDIW